MPGWRPDYAPAPASLTVRLEADLVADTTVGHGVFEVSIGGAQFPITRAARLGIECQPAFRTKETIANGSFCWKSGRSTVKDPVTPGVK